MKRTLFAILLALTCASAQATGSQQPRHHHHDHQPSLGVVGLGVCLLVTGGVYLIEGRGNFCGFSTTHTTPPKEDLADNEALMVTPPQLRDTTVIIKQY